MVRSSKRGATNDDYGDLIDELDSICSRLDTLESPSGESLASTLTRARDNIAELQTRVTISAEASVNVTTPVNNLYTTGQVAVIPFTIAARRKVYFRSSAYIAMLIESNGTLPAVNPYVSVVITIQVKNLTTGLDIAPTTTPVIFSGGWVSGQTTRLRLTHRGFLDDYYVMNPADYQASIEVAITNFAGTAGDVTIFNPRLAVEIMEKA